ncbi:tyrosine-type recombinase/integrase [Ancylobacter polymorphus]|uniref:Tyrosine-type recombinase/integrase n=1 Tax=Ancylobacter polymorphus TaxID=223390 RepID=A0A9E7A6K3_9HYPH|nr:tyrosine-type recombinase/integrase [Ancylobacter polymorphus]UOK73828.1 tyrosine-type recombinase/integrase [Ancylobacter polymorphus]
MSELHEVLESYLTVRRALGFKLERQETRLRSFVTFMDARGATVVTAKLAVAWAGSQCGPATWSSRLSTVRSFAQHLTNTEPRTEIPPSGIYPPQRRPRPYIYSDAEIDDLLATMPALHRSGLQGRTYQCFFGLLAVAGLRFSEAANLARHDADLEQGVLTIRETKFGKSRIIPLHPTTIDALAAYVAERDACPVRRKGRYFFTGDRGAGLNHANVHKSFAVWTRRARLRLKQRSGPRIHDLRHTFAVRTLLGWYHDGEDVERRLPALTTYMGHTHLRDTYWYLTASPELLDHARLRLEARWEATA